MDKTDLEILHFELYSKLWNNLLFYIPKDIIDLDVIKKIEGLKNIDAFFDRIIILDEQVGFMHFDPNKDKTKYLKKTPELSEIIFLLLENKSKLKDFELSYILDKHYEQTASLFYLTNWLNSNLHHFKKLDINTKGLFKLQFLFYKKHLEEIITNFYPSRQDLPHNKFNTLDLIETNFKTVSKNINPNTSNILSQIENHRASEIINIFRKYEQNKEHKIPIEIKKAPLLSEKEAEQVLLKSIFNIQ